MPSPIIAIPADTREIEGYYWHATPQQYVNAVVKGAGATAIVVPALESGNDIDAILDRVDGVLISGSRSNVIPRSMAATRRKRTALMTRPAMRPAWS